MQCIGLCKVISRVSHALRLSSLNLNGKDLIPDGVMRKNAANRLLKRCIFLGNAFRVRTDPYLVARRSSGTFREVIVVYLEATQVRLNLIKDSVMRVRLVSIFFFGLKRA